MMSADLRSQTTERGPSPRAAAAAPTALPPPPLEATVVQPPPTTFVNHVSGGVSIFGVGVADQASGLGMLSREEAEMVAMMRATQAGRVASGVSVPAAAAARDAAAASTAAASAASAAAGAAPAASGRAAARRAAGSRASSPVPDDSSDGDFPSPGQPKPKKGQGKNFTWTRPAASQALLDAVFSMAEAPGDSAAVHLVFTAIIEKKYPELIANGVRPPASTTANRASKIRSASEKVFVLEQVMDSARVSGMQMSVDDNERLMTKYSDLQTQLTKEAGFVNAEKSIILQLVGLGKVLLKNKGAEELAAICGALDVPVPPSLRAGEREPPRSFKPVSKSTVRVQEVEDIRLMERAGAAKHAPPGKRDVAAAAAGKRDSAAALALAAGRALGGGGAGAASKSPKPRPTSSAQSSEDAAGSKRRRVSHAATLREFGDGELADKETHRMLRQRERREQAQFAAQSQQSQAMMMMAMAMMSNQGMDVSSVMRTLAPQPAAGPRRAKRPRPASSGDAGRDREEEEEDDVESVESDDDVESVESDDDSELDDEEEEEEVDGDAADEE